MLGVSLLQPANKSLTISMSSMEYFGYAVDAGHEAHLADMPAASEHKEWMRLALAQAEAAVRTGEVPIGAVVVDGSGNVVGSGHNLREHTHDPTDHAEMVAIRAAAKHLGTWQLSECTLVVTVEPCLMCAGAILMARIPTVVFGAWEQKTGAAGSQYDVLRDGRFTRQVQVYAGVLRYRCARLMSDFFATKRLGQR